MTLSSLCIPKVFKSAAKSLKIGSVIKNMPKLFDLLHVQGRYSKHHKIENLSNLCNNLKSKELSYVHVHVNYTV